MKKQVPCPLIMETLSRSSSKQKYSFGKSARFHYKTTSNDLFYTLPSTLSAKGAIQGKDARLEDLKKKTNLVQPCMYTLPSTFNLKGVSFRKSREECKGMSLKELFRTDPNNPGPGSYGIYQLGNTGSGPTWSMRMRTHKNSRSATGRAVHVPGPGTYETPLKINSEGRYCSSSWKNVRTCKFTDAKIARFTYQDSRDINERLISGEGTSALSSVRMDKGRSFCRTDRGAELRRDDIPGPGAYSFLAELGNVPLSRRLIKNP